MKKYIDLDSWPRKDHFQFFSQFEEPFWGVTIELNCSRAYQRSKAENTSFFLYYLHKSILAINQIEEFRYRIDTQGRVVVFDRINASATINRPDGTFGFSYIEFAEDYAEFEQNAKVEIERVQNTRDLIPAVSSENVVHYSSLPWLKFTALSHARKFSHPDSIPKISFGKMIKQGEERIMPVSIHVHHGLVDGYHVGQYVDLFQSLLDR